MSTTISNADPAYKSMNYTLLRDEGLKFIEALAGKSWTDYNIHDPGITLLEILCYAITDLGYRTNFPIKDLLADTQTQGYGDGFHGITDILPCRPVTLTDLRKIVLDQSAVLNAKVAPSTKGLYDVWLEFEEHNTLGNLNSNVEGATIDVSGNIYNIEVAFSFWDELSGIDAGQTLTTIAMATYEYDRDGNTLLDDPVLIAVNDAPSQDISDYYAEVVLTVQGITPVTSSAWIKIISEGFTQETPQNLEAAIVTELTSLTGVTYRYWQRIQEAITQTNAVRTALQHYRPLCGDFNFKAYRVEEIGVKATIDLTLDARAENVLAEIYYRIHTFLSPSPVFHTYAECVAKGKTTEELFEGPLLTHGFLDTGELEKLRIREVIHVADLIPLLTAIPGLGGIRDFRIANYINNNVFDENVTGSLQLVLPELYEPLLSPYKSQLNFYKNGQPVAVDTTAAINAFNALKAKDRKNKVAAVYDVSVPKGTNSDVGNYYSLQHHFPATYGIGSEELPASASNERKAKARQLQAYLLFFEQLLANGFSQLSHIKALFSTDPSVPHTYFTKQLTANEVPGADALLTGTYAADLPGMAEPPGTAGEPGTFHKRRIRFLEHLMARLGEDMTDYKLLRYAGGESLESIITAMIPLLNAYPDLGLQRGTGFNYTAGFANMWNTNNVSGLKKRISILLGIADYNRKHLVTQGQDQITNYFTFSSPGGQYRFQVTGYDLNSVTTTYPNPPIAETDAWKVAVLGTQRSQYRLTGSVANSDLSFQLLDDQGNPIAATTQIFADEAARGTYIQGIIDFLNTQNEGFHVIEHHLLQPVGPLSNDLNIPAEGGGHLGYPYTFRISFILPVQNEKFGSREFRHHTEDVIRRETPAHIVPHIHWVTNNVLYNFEVSYRAWLEQGVYATDTTLRNALVSNFNAVMIEAYS